MTALYSRSHSLISIPKEAVVRLRTRLMNHKALTTNALVEASKSDVEEDGDIKVALIEDTEIV